jgi:hypothetical protein
MTRKGIQSLSPSSLLVHLIVIAHRDMINQDLDILGWVIKVQELDGQSASQTVLHVIHYYCLVFALKV